MDTLPALVQVLPFTRGLTLMWWATATWWIPMLLVLGLWRHVVRRFPLHYDPLYWVGGLPAGHVHRGHGAAVSGDRCALLFLIPRWFVFVALGAWTLTLAAMVAHVWKSLARTKSFPAR